MAGQRLALLLVAVGGGVVHPDLERVVRAARHEAAVAGRARAGVGGYDAAGGRGGGPAHAVDTQPVGVEDGVLPAVVAELEDRDVAVGGGAGQEAACFVGGPRHDVDRGLVQGEVEDALPGAGLLAPDEDFAVVAG